MFQSLIDSLLQWIDMATIGGRLFCLGTSAYAAAAAAIIAVAGSAYSAYSANSAKKEGQAASREQQEAVAKALEAAQISAQELRDARSDPFALFEKIILKVPGILDIILPQLRRQSTDTASEFTRSNIANYREAINLISPAYARQAERRVGLLNEMDPANLGQEEIAAITRKVSPLIPSGTLDPTTGAVQGATTSPVSLYRNLISSAYQDRRGKFNEQNRLFLTDTESAAARQQEKASSFLPALLGFTADTSTKLTGATLAQEQADISAADAYINALLGIPTPAFNSAPYDAMIGQSVQSGTAAVAGAYNNYQNQQLLRQLVANQSTAAPAASTTPNYGAALA